MAHHSRGLRAGGRARALATLSIALIIGACSPAAPAPTAAPPTDAPVVPTDAPTGAPTTMPTAPPTASPTEAPQEALRLAFLSFAVANSYDAPMLAAAQAAASALNSTLTVFDANNSPDAQFAQLQDALASGQYDGIIVQPIFGPALIPTIEEGIAGGAQIAVLDQILGEDLTTSEKQVEGLAANVVFRQSEIGRKQGELTVQACEEFQLDPCNVGFLYNIKVSSLDTAIRTAFDEVIADHPQIQVVAEGEAFYTVALGLLATQDMLTARPDINVIVGADQGITGAVTAIADAERTGEIVLIGYGGAGIAYNRIRAGEQYATVAQRPATEGQYVVEDLVRAIRTGEPSPARDPVDELPDEGIVTQDNVDQFVAEWPG
ncbi:MAG TPA: sugar ABC transporter substrate-binding protein [Candidatus Limnocylindria bacterium]|nr:sugar ABC transporter substrate-binding protein [Candidatus Limnocylindria bacterium]